MVGNCRLGEGTPEWAQEIDRLTWLPAHHRPSSRSDHLVEDEDAFCVSPGVGENVCDTEGPSNEGTIFGRDSHLNELSSSNSRSELGSLCLECEPVLTEVLV